jgi:hypothetical protein
MTSGVICPAGIFMPCILIGCALGQVYAEIHNILFVRDDILWKIDFKTNIVTNVIDNLGQPNTYFNVPSDIFYNNRFVGARVLRLTIDKAGNIYMLLMSSNENEILIVSPGAGPGIIRYYIIKIEAKTEKLIVLSTS